MSTLTLKLLPSKVTCPPWPPAALERSRPLVELSGMAAPALVLVQAPAGFGKTLLVSSWLRNREGKVAWYCLEGSDNDPARFVAYLSEALRVATAQPVALSPEPISSPEPITNSPELNKSPELKNSADVEHTLEPVMAALLVELAGIDDHLYLVLDDYHCIESDTIHSGVRFLLRHAPANLTLVVNSRTEPPLGIAALRVAGKLQIIDAQALAFDRQEVEQFIKGQGKLQLDSASIDQLLERTEGWPSALQLFALSALDAETSDQLLEEMAQGHGHVIDYLSEEVLARLEPDLREFLLHVCILDHCNHRLVNALTGGSNGQARLEQLEKMGLFIVPLDNGRRWYRFHALFRQFLRHQLQLDHPQLEPVLHGRACDAWRAEGQPAEALAHALAGADAVRVTEILIEHGDDFYEQGQFRLPTRCLDWLTAERVSRDARLALLYTHLQLAQCEYQRAEKMLRQSQQFMQQDKEQWQQFQGEFGALRAQMANDLGDNALAKSIAEEALGHIGTERYKPRIMALTAAAGASFGLGDLELAQIHMAEAEQLARSYNANHVVIYTLCLQSDIAAAQGYLQKAFKVQERALQFARQHRLQSLSEMEFVYRIRGQILWEWHRIDESEQAVQEAEAIARPLGKHWLLQVYSLRLKLQQARGQVEQCARTATQIQSLLSEEGYHRDWRANAEAALVNYWLAVDARASLEEWLQVVTPPGESAANHYDQCHARNQVRALMGVGSLERAQDILKGLQSQAELHGLVLDQNRNQILLAEWHWRQQQRQTALEHLHRALELANTTGCISSFLRLGKPLLVMLKALSAERPLGEFENQRLERLSALCRELPELTGRAKIQVDEAIIEDILDSEEVPELLQYTPLSKREWQVLKLIHQGLSNERIAQALKVAPSTIKTHIRNLYRKLNVADRKEAIALTEKILLSVQGE